MFPTFGVTFARQLFPVVFSNFSSDENLTRSHPFFFSFFLFAIDLVENMFDNEK